MNLNQLFESPQQCPECGGISFSDLILAEKKDACYYKVKASAKVWPSAYASGRLVQCRKKGAANYGNKSESVAEGSEESYIIVRTNAEGKKDVFAGNFDTYEQAQKELDACLAHPLHTKYKQKFEIKRKGQQGVAEGMWDQFQSIPELEQAIKNLIMGYKGGLNLTDKGRAQLLLSINKGKRILAKKKQQQQGMAEGVTPASTSKVLRLIDRHNPEWFEDYGMGEVEDTVVELAERGEFQGMSAVDAMALVHQELEKYYGQLREQGVAEANDPNFVGFMNKALGNKVDPKREQPKTGHDWYDNAPTMSMNNMPSYKHAFKFGMSVLQSMDAETKQHFAEADNDELFSYLMKLARKKGFSPKYFVEEDMIEVPDLFSEIFHDPAMQDWEWADLLRSTLKEQGVAEDQLDEKWSQKYKSSINCANPKGFSQRAHCAGRNKNESVAESLGKQIHSTFQSMGDSFSDAHLAKGISYFLQGRHQEGENWLRGKIPQAAQSAVFSKLRTLQAQGGVDVNKNANVQQYIDDKLVPWVKNQIQQHVKEGEQQKGADYRDPKEVDYDDEYDAMVARVKRLAGLGPMKTVYDPTKRVYKNIPTAQQPKK